MVCVLSVSLSDDTVSEPIFTYQPYHHYMKTTIALTLLAIACTQASASHTLRLQPSSANQMTVQHTPGTNSYVCYTTGTDPFVYVSSLERPLAANETQLVFEYMASKNSGHVETFFHYPPMAGISTVFAGLKQSGTWQTATLDISAGCNNFAWGAIGDQLRLDLGGVAQNTIQIRNIRIQTPGEQYVAPGDPFAPEAVKALGMPVLEIVTDGGEEPTCEPISPPDGGIGAGITNATKVPGRVRIIEPDGRVSFDSGEYVKKKSGMTVKIRGNTSAYTPKKPYKIKLTVAADMLGRTGEEFADKNWVLIKDEEQLMRNGFKMCEFSGQQWAPKWRYVNVVFNGSFRGFYILAEGVERNPLCRLNVAEDGFIAEMDAYWWNEGGAYFNSVNHPVHNYTLKYPDYEDLTDEQKVKIQHYLTQFEESIEDGTYPQYIDVESFAGWLVAHDILGTLDSAGSNMLLTRFDLDESTPIRMGNLWDFDSTERMTDAWSNVHTHNFTKYFDSPSKAFTREYVRAYNRMKDHVFTDMMNFVSAFATSDLAVPFERSVNLDNEKWNTKYHSGIFSSRRSINWYSTRWTWMNNAVSQLAIVSSIDDVEADNEPTVTVCGNNILTPGHITVYDTTGRRVAEGNDCVEVNASGLYLVVTPHGSVKTVVR